MQGSLKTSVLFYGYYTEDDILHNTYKLPLAYFLASLAVYGYSFVAILRKYVNFLIIYLNVCANLDVST